MKFSPTKTLSRKHIKSMSAKMLASAWQRTEAQVNFGGDYGEDIAKANLKLLTAELKARGLSKPSLLGNLNLKSGDFWKGVGVGAVVAFVFKGLRS